MTPLEIFLISIVTIWTLVFIVFGVALVFVLIQLKKALDKINQMIETAEEVTWDVGSSLKTAATGVTAIITKNLIGSLAKKLLSLKSQKNK